MTEDVAAEPRPRLARSARGGDTRPMEARIAKVEAGVEYLQREVAEDKGDIRAARNELIGEINALRRDTHAGLDAA